MILFMRKEGQELDFRVPCEQATIQTRVTETLCWALLVLSISVKSIGNLASVVREGEHEPEIF